MNHTIRLEKGLNADVKFLQEQFPGFAFETGSNQFISPGNASPAVCFYRHSPPKKNECAFAYEMPPNLSTSTGYWIASVLYRLQRRVKKPPPADETLANDLFNKGFYRSAKAYPKNLPHCGVLFFKPRSVVTPAAVADLQERLVGCGYAVFCARAVAPEEIKERQLAREHYLAHVLVAERGNLLPRERLNLLRIYDREEFNARFQQHAWDVPVMPALEFMRKFRVPKKVIKEWSETTAERKGLDSGEVDAANEISDCKYVNVFQHPGYFGGKPVFLVNPHILSVVDWFENIDGPLFVFFIHAVCGDALSWDRMRKEFCGASDPVHSLPGSIRKDCYEGLFPVKVKSAEKAKRIFNCIHLSNGIYESLREANIWFGIDPLQLNAGKALQKVPGVDVRELIAATYLDYYGTRYALTEITNGRSLAACLEIFAEGKPVKTIDEEDNAESLRRIDAAHRMTKSLLKENPSVIATFVSGSASLNRASKDSDMDLIVVTDDGGQKKRIERRFENDIVIECEWRSRTGALEVAKGLNASEFKGMRESARLHFALPVFDPTGLKAVIAGLAKEVRPAKENVLASLQDAYLAFHALLVASGSRNPVAQREGFRAIGDSLAVLNLQLSPVKYHKPKWVMQDLALIHQPALRDFLLRCYSIKPDIGQEKAGKDLQCVKEMVQEVTALFNFPAYEEILKHGYLDEYPQLSYLCRCLMDAFSLLNDDYLPEASYCGKFVTRLLAALCAMEMKQGEEESLSPSGIFSATGLDVLVANYRLLFPDDFTPVRVNAFKKCAALLEGTKQKLYAVYSGAAASQK